MASSCRHDHALLLVPLDDRCRSDLRTIRILARVTACIALPQQIPALVQFNFDLLETHLIVIGQFVLSVQTLLLVHESLDLREELSKGNSAPKSVRLVIGNPLFMREMVKHVPDAASYAPVTVLIDERADGVCLSYD